MGCNSANEILQSFTVFIHDDDDKDDDDVAEDDDNEVAKDDDARHFCEQL